MCQFQPVGTKLPVYLNATDQDFGDVVTFNIDPSAVSQYFTIDGHYVITEEPVDLGTLPDQQYHLVVQAVDKGGLFCTVDVYIEVTQVNDPHKIENLPNVIFVDARTAKNGDLVSVPDELSPRFQKDFVERWILLQVYKINVNPKEPDDALAYSWDIPSPADGTFRLDPITGEYMPYSLKFMYLSQECKEKVFTIAFFSFQVRSH